MSAAWPFRSRLWWNLRMLGHAALQREWEDERVQTTVRERFPNAKRAIEARYGGARD